MRRRKKPARLTRKRFKKSNILLLLLSIIVVVQAVLIIRLWPKKEKVKPARFPVIPKNKIAIVIDDWGYNRRNLNFIREIKVPLTVSILPQLNYSKRIAVVARKNSKEVIIHLPLEPHKSRRVGLEKGVILTGMSEEKIIEIFKKALKGIPYSKGVSNHMGSKATEDRRVMKILFKQFKKNKLYFLDSLVTSDSVCEDLAKDMKLRFSKRDIFLDNELNADYIKNQLDKLIARAKQDGEAIGIGHDRSVTLRVIKDSISEIEKQGIEFVFVSDLVR